ncbi:MULTISPECIES: occludin [Bacteroides]|uniref:Occludin n=1 Tax=Bacteroides muris (ex Fokt et al. 2023) TaxID=2937417 RepID=A0A9X2NT45_9BACE|nr:MULTISPECIES: occludin [Bacteroides]MCR6505369.1 occludin [Bacteroides muris (ex Fokt et al. 2023)]MCR6507144.1 occludin [Bacteroides muris (ex Fokt et al. 2023)]
MIKRMLLCVLVLFTGTLSVHAQEEVATDTISGLPATVKNYDGFLLDMGLMNLSAPTLPKFTLEIPDASKDYSRIFRLNPNMTYSQGLSNIFSLSNSRYFSSNPFGLTGFWGSTDNLQMGSFTLKNGMRIHTYGEYDKDGWRVPNPSALPWEKNNFKGAFELKSANGAFGIRIEVQQGRNYPY